MRNNFEEILPISRLPELLEMLKEHTVEVHRFGDTDDEYKYLEEGSACITVLNPYQEDRLYIDLDAEVTLTFGVFHTHYYPDLDGYSHFESDLFLLLQNELCSATLYCEENKEWLGSRAINKEEISLGCRKVFDFIFKIKEFRDKVDKRGGEAHYHFWNPVDDILIPILPKGVVK